MEKTFERNQICADMAGWESLEYIDCQQIVRNYKFDGKIVVELATGKSWHTMEADSIAAEVKAEQGGYEAAVEVLYHGQGTNDGQEVYGLQQCRVVLRLTDYNGQQWIAGCKETPLRTTVDDTREAEATGMAGYTIRFEGKIWWPLLKI